MNVPPSWAILIAMCHDDAPWLGKSATCWQHVGPTAKCQHIWPACPCRGDTKLILTQHFCVGDC